MDFTASFRQCQNLEGSLAEIENRYEQEIVTTYMLDSSTVYIGLNDIVIENKFEWIGTRHRLGNFSNWGFGQPANAFQQFEEDCVEILLFGSWNDIDCKFVRSSICEIQSIQEGNKHRQKNKNFNRSEAHFLYFKPVMFENLQFNSYKRPNDMKLENLLTQRLGEHSYL